MLSALPSITHMALVKLCNENKLKFIISQNVDGLHRRSGIPSNKLSELHGNTNLEVCIKCNHYYLKDYHVRTSLIVDEHKTGRICTIQNCDGELKDTIINFGETLPMDELNKAEQNTNKGDICLALGSSLTVSPACNLAKEFGVNRKKDLVIVNLQRTNLDSKCSVRIFAKCDDVMRLLMKKLKLEIPEWRLVRYININSTAMIQDKQESTSSFDVAAVEEDGTPSSLFKSVVLRVGDKKYFIGDPKWRKDEDKETPRKEQLEILEHTFKKMNKRLRKYAKMIYDAGFHTIDSLTGLSMDKAVDIMEGSNNYERRLIVDKFYKSILDLQEGHDLKHKASFEDVDYGKVVYNDDEKKEKIEFSLELEFAKHYNEPNLLIDLSKYMRNVGIENEAFVLKLIYNPFKRVWSVPLLNELKDDNVVTSLNKLLRN